MLQSKKTVKWSNRNYITQQKRYVVNETILTTVALSPAGMLGLTLGLGIIIFGVGVVMLGGVPAVYASVTNQPDLPQFLWDIFHDVDEIRGDVSLNVGVVQERISHTLTLITNHHDAFAAAHPSLVDAFESVQTEFTAALYQIRLFEGSIDTAMEQITNLDFVLDRLDTLSDKLMHIIDNM